MTNYINDQKKSFAIWKVLTAIAALECTYGFIFSPDQGHRNITPLLIVTILSTGINPLGNKHSRTSLIAGLIGAAVTAAVIISLVGIWILNIRCLAIVYSVFMTVYSIAQLVMLAVESKENR